MKLTDFLTLMEALAPAALAESWDNVGLLIGSCRERADRILVALDLSRQVAEEAVSVGADLVLTHHPIFFHGIKRIVPGSAVSGAAYTLIRAGIGHFAAHTNLDCARQGVNDCLAELFELEDIAPLAPAPMELVKLQVYTPAAQAGAVESALMQAGAGKLGAYSDCGFTLRGEGSFLPLAGARPAIGRRGVKERVAEIKLETTVQKPLLANVLAALRRAHPYETPAFDVFPLQLSDPAQGSGRLGSLAKAIPLGAFARLVKAKLGGCVQYAGDAQKSVRRVALCGGSGGSLLADAQKSGADVYLTAEVRHSDARDAGNMAIVQAGHYETERPVLSRLIERLQTGTLELQYKGEWILSEAEKPAFFEVSPLAGPPSACCPSDEESSFSQGRPND